MTEQWNNLQYCITTTNEKKYTTYFFLSILEHRELFSPIDYQLISIRQVPPNFLRQISPTISTSLLLLFGSHFMDVINIFYRYQQRCSDLPSSIVTNIDSIRFSIVDHYQHRFDQIEQHQLLLSCKLLNISNYKLPSSSLLLRANRYINRYPCKCHQICRQYRRHPSC